MTSFKWTFVHLTLFIAFFLLFFTGGYPGAINPDTADILHQARGLVVTDWHSPAAVFLISFLIPISRTPENVLFFQSLTCAAFFVVMIAVVSSPSDTTMAPRRNWILCALAAALLFVFGLCLFAMQCFILKDTWVVIGYMGLVAALLNGRGGRRSPTLNLVLILIPSLIRPTSFLATIPFAYYFLLKRDAADESPAVCEWSRWKIRKATVWAISLATIVCVATVPVVVYVNKVLIGAESTHPESALQIFDLAGISAKTGKDQFAAEGLIPAGNQQPSVVSCYDPISANPYIWGDCKWVTAEIGAKGLVGSAALSTAWVHAIVAHPLAYAMHRLGYAKLLLGRVTAVDFFQYENQINTPQGVTFLPSDWRQENDFWTPRLPIVVTLRILQPLLKDGLGFPIVWILADLICAGVIIAARRRDADAQHNPVDDAIVACALSSLLSLALFAGLAPSYTPRYVYWTFISTFIAVLLFVWRARSLKWRPLFG